MPIESFADVQRAWRFPEGCTGRDVASAILSTDQRTVAQTGRRLILSWPGPITDRARFDVLNLQVSAYPAILKIVIASQCGPQGTPWDVATATVTYANAAEAQNERPVCVVGGFPTERWALFAWLDPASVATEGKLYAALRVDRGGTGTPYLLLATGVAP